MENLKLWELTINSREVAKMVEKEHSKLLRDIKIYIKYFNEANFGFVDFFKENTYLDSKGEQRPCYEVTKKGCELIAHKLTGKKGVLFTASYINRFHEMEEELKNPKQDLNLKQPWFIRNVGGENFIFESDFIDITGVDIKKHKLFYRPEYFTGGCDWNAGFTDKGYEELNKKYGFNYHNGDLVHYLYFSGVITALEILSQDKKIKMNEGAEKLLLGAINEIRFPENKLVDKKHNIVEKSEKCDIPIQISINFGETEKKILV